MVSVSDSQLEVKLCSSQEAPQQEPAATQAKPQEPQLQNPPDPQTPLQQEPPSTQDTAENAQEPQEDPTDTLELQESAKEHTPDSQNPLDELHKAQQETPTAQDTEQEPPQTQQPPPEDAAAAAKQAGLAEDTVVETSVSDVQTTAETVASSSRECPTPGNSETEIDTSNQDSPSGEDGGTKEEELTPVTESTDLNSSSVQCSTEAKDDARSTPSQVEAESPPKSCDEEETAVCSEMSTAASPPPPGRVVVQEDGSVLVRIARTGLGGGGAEKQIQFSNKFMFDLD